MGASDIAVLQFTFAFALPSVALIIVLFVLVQRVNRLKTQMTSSFLLRLEQVYDEVSEPKLRALLADLNHMQSEDWYLRNRGLIRILVINPKTGELRGILK